MRTIRAALWIVLGWVALAAAPAEASRRLVTPAEGFDEAAMAVVGTVEEAWLRKLDHALHRIYRVRVLAAWKGTAKPGDTLWAVEPWANGFGAMWFDERRPTLFYLVPVDAPSGRVPAKDEKPEHVERREAAWRANRLAYADPATVPPADDLAATGKWAGPDHWAPSNRVALPDLTTPPLFTSIREMSFRAPANAADGAVAAPDAGDWRVAGRLAEEAALLDLFAEKGTGTGDRAFWCAQLDASDNDPVLVHALDALPRPLGDADRARLFAVVDRLPADHGAMRMVMGRLAYSGGDRPSWPPDVFLRLWRRSGEKERREWIAAHSSARAMLTPDAVAALAPELEARALAGTADAFDAAETLASLAPAAAADWLRRHPDAPALPALAACRLLKENRSAFDGADFAPAALDADPARLREAFALSLAGDKTVYLSTDAETLADPRGPATWRALAPFLAASLALPDSPGRRQRVAFLRTMGVPVARRDGAYALEDANEAETPPLTLAVAAPPAPVPAGAPVELRWTLRLARPTVLPGNPTHWLWRWEGVNPGGSEWTFGAWSGLLRSGKPSSRVLEDDYLLHPAGTELTGRHALQGDWFERPGAYTLRLILSFDRYGADRGMDAWTGVLAAPPITIHVKAPDMF